MKSSKRMLSYGFLIGLIGVPGISPRAGEHRTPDRDAESIRLWNEIAAEAITTTAAHAPAASGVLLAIVQLGVYDAVVAIAGCYEPYAAAIDAPRGASIAAAAAQSAHDVLVDLVPAQAGALDARLADALAAIPDGPARSAGLEVGRQAAEAILADRQGDGRLAPVGYTFAPPGPGVYQPTPPAMSTTPLVPWVSRVRPFTMTSPSQFRPGPTPALDSRAWARAYERTRKWGDARSSARSAAQSEIAIFWTEHTPRQWNRNIRLQSAREHLDAVETARLLAATNTAMADAWIGCWDAKYHHSFWRPVTAIRQGDSDGRADTVADPAWTPFQTTPNHPEYPAAHACVSTAAALAMKRSFGRDRADFPMNAIVDNVTYVHQFDRYTTAAAEARIARIYGGMHYDFSLEAGERLGRNVVRQMFARGFFRRAR